ncbi:hypothetical protein HYC85_003551 [Camellia sinensis]|uniref:Methyltransferase type 11 domain-containing protein n=1 Tax=Camellia sinensis TaxID=4442 RepID=A0A7J7HW58_CAMSI|nr:hypothetical protein HYC85_003551 [Camellia sinensis]
MVRRSRTEAHDLTAPKTGNRTPKWAKWPTTTKCSLRTLRDGLRDLSLPSGKETEKIESGSQTETRHRKGFGSPEAGLTAATLKLLNEHIMQHHQALNRRQDWLTHTSNRPWRLRASKDETSVMYDSALRDITGKADYKKTFPTALCLGASLGAISRLLRWCGAIEKLIMMDTSYDMVKLCKDAEEDASNKNIETSFVVGDEEFLPVKESSVDLVISCLGLHWTNDLPGAMIQSRLALKPNGLFLAAILGGETLKELRIAYTVAQMEREGGISPRLSPLAQVRDAGNLLTRAGFNLPGVDVDEYTVKYPSGELFCPVV